MTGERLLTMPGEANDFELSGGGLQLHYSASSLAGGPQFSYRDGSKSVSRSGDEVSVERTSLGTLVTIMVEAVPDFRTVRATLILPPVNLDESSAEVETYVVLSTGRDNIAGPGAIHGQIVSFDPLSVSGSARHVQF